MCSLLAGVEEQQQVNSPMNLMNLLSFLLLFFEIFSSKVNCFPYPFLWAEIKFLVCKGYYS